MVASIRDRGLLQSVHNVGFPKRYYTRYTRLIWLIYIFLTRLNPQIDSRNSSNKSFFIIKSKCSKQIILTLTFLFTGKILRIPCSRSKYEKFAFCDNQNKGGELYSIPSQLTELQTRCVQNYR